jgi:hypothetical protein
MTRIRLNIEELVLHGFDAANRHVIGDAIQAELERRFAAGSLPPTWRGGTVIERAANAHARVPATPRGTGTAIGAALHHSLTTMPQGERK